MQRTTQKLRWLGLITGGLLCCAVLVVGEETTPRELLDLPLLFEDNFEKGELSHWEPSDPKAWKISDINWPGGLVDRSCRPYPLNYEGDQLSSVLCIAVEYPVDDSTLLSSKSRARS